jgi:N-acetylneuraminic acid mutarotase
VDKAVKWQGNATQNVTVTNTGTAPATVKIGEQPGGFQLQSTGPGAPLNLVSGHFPAGSHHGANGAVVPMTAKPTDSTNPSAAPWTSIANFPTTIQDNASDFLNGKLYSAFGYTGSADTSALYVYDPATTTWTALAPAADTREAPAHGFINGKWYVVGGWASSGNPDPKLEIYDPATNSWTTGAASPAPLAGSGSAVLNGKLYVIGGCDAANCGSTSVYVYDPSSNSWAQAANYPESISWLSAGAVNGTLYTAGGYNGTASVKHSYAYDASANSWSAGPDLPADLWGSFYAAANGQLLVSGGVTANSSQITNQGYSLNPGTGTWTALPNANTSLYRGGSALGFYEVGGNPGGALTPPVATAEVLPGFDQGGAVNVDWLSEDQTQLTLAPGASGTVKVKVDASVPSITQPGTFTASLAYQTDTPYGVAATGVTMTVTPPATWGKINGTVYGTDKNGNTAPIAGATVQVNTWAFTYTLKTDKNGNYALWLDYRNNTLQVIAAKDGYQPAEKDVDVTAGDTVTTDFTLKIDP